MQISNTIVIRQPPAAVFAFIADAANIPKWNYAVTSARQVTSGPPGVGTRIRQTRSSPGTGDEELEITEFVQDRRLVLRGDLGPLSGTLDYVLVDVPEGTKLTNSADLAGRGAARLLAPLAAARVRSAVAANLEKLRELLESSG